MTLYQIIVFGLRWTNSKDTLQDHQPYNIIVTLSSSESRCTPRLVDSGHQNNIDLSLLEKPYISVKTTESSGEAPVWSGSGRWQGIFSPSKRWVYCTVRTFKRRSYFCVFCKIFSIDWHKTIDDRMIGLVDAFPSSYKISLEMPGPTTSDHFLVNLNLGAQNSTSSAAIRQERREKCFIIIKQIRMELHPIICFPLPLDLNSRH